MLVAAINPSASTAGTIFVLSGSGFAPSNPSFGSIDGNTGAYTGIVSSLPSELLRNLAWNASISAFYTIDGDADTPPIALSTIDTSGSITPIGSLASNRIVSGMAYRQSDSTIYAYDKDGSDYGAINSVLGTWSNIQTSGTGIPDFGNSGGRFAILNDILYLTGESGGNGKFGSIGYTSTSTFAQIGPDNPLFINMILASDGTSLFGIYGDGTDGNQALYSINPNSGITSFISTISGVGLGSRFYGADFQSSDQAVPEPSLCIISVVSLACAGFAKRRQIRRCKASR